MGLLMFRCPRTGRNYSTGLNVDADGLASVPHMLDAARCPYCKIDHEWRPSETWLAETIPPHEPTPAAAR
jgi:hypothetical protein